MTGALPRTPSPAWLLACGDFFFRHRNTVFPLMLAGLCILLPPRLAGGRLALDRWLDLLGLATLLAGQALRAAVIGFAYIKRGGLNKKVHAATLVTGGLFGVCRNPIYLGNGLIVGGLLIVHGNPWAWLLGLLAFGFAYLSIVASEESFLVGKFGAAYLDYCRTVGRWWPDFSKFGEATRGMRFDWRRVVANDYGTLFAWVSGAALLFAYEGAYHEGLAAAAPRLLAAAALVLIMGILALAVRYQKKSGRLAAIARPPEPASGGAPGSGTLAPSRLAQIFSLQTRFLVLVLLPPIVLTRAVWSEDGAFDETLEWLGYAAIVVCVLGRAWCSAYIAGSKQRELVDCGPYSIVRNPLYGFSLIGLAGVGLLTGSLVWAALLTVGAAAYYSAVVRREEVRLRAGLRADHRRYLERTPRWLPDPRLWCDVEEVTIRPALLTRALLDGACLLAVVPLLDALADAHAAGILPALLSLP